MSWLPLADLPPSSLLMDFSQLDTVLVRGPGDTTLRSRLLSSFWTFTRSSTATRVNAAGQIESVAADVPRIDHDPVTLQPRGLLVEGQRTNLLLRTEEFDNASWIVQRSTVTANATTSPDGTVNADRLVDTTDSATHRVYLSTAKASSAIAYTGSVYLKAGTLGFATLRLAGPGETNFTSVGINLSTGELSSLSTTGFTNASASVANAGNGWWRLMLTGTSDAAASITITIGVATTLTASSSYVGTGSGSIFLWGAQLEAGAFASSYIPTGASQVTRLADVAGVTGANFSDWFNQGAGTFLTEAFVSHTADTYVWATGVNRLGLRRNSADLLQAYNRINGSSDINVSGAANPFLGAIRAAVAFESGNSAISPFGRAPGTSAAAFTVNETNLFIGSLNGSAGHIFGHIRSIRYWPTRLTNAQLQTISGPQPTSIATASGAGNLPLTGTASSLAIAAASAFGSLPLEGTALADLIAAAAASAFLPLAGSGSATGLVSVRGTGTGSISLAGSGTAQVSVRGTANRSIALTGTSTGQVAVFGTATGQVDVAGSSTGSVRVSGSASGFIPLTGFAEVAPNYNTGSLIEFRRAAYRPHFKRDKAKPVFKVPSRNNRNIKMSHTFTAKPKHPDAKWNAQLSFKDWLANSEILLRNPGPSVIAKTPGVIISGAMCDDDTVYWNVSGGEDRRSYKVEISVQTSGGQKEVVTVVFPVLVV